MATGKTPHKLPKYLPKRTGKAQKQRMMEQSKQRSAERKRRNYEAQFTRQLRNESLIRSAGVTFATRTERRKWLKSEVPSSISN